MTVEPFTYTEAKSPTVTPSLNGLPEATVNTPVADTQLPEAYVKVAASVFVEPEFRLLPVGCT